MQVGAEVQAVFRCSGADHEGPEKEGEVQTPWYPRQGHCWQTSNHVHSRLEKGRVLGVAIAVTALHVVGR